MSLYRYIYSVAAAAAALAGHAGDWPRFRGPNGDGVVADGKLPTKLDAQSIAWTANLPGRGLSSPIIVGDRIFLTCASGGRQDRLHVLCLNAADGSLRWERQLWATGRTMTHEKICPAAPSPATDGHYIYALFSSNDCAAFDFEGNLIWYRGLGRDYPNASNSLGMASSLLVLDGVVIAQVENDSESFTAGLDAQTGVNRWKLDCPKKANWSSPASIAGPDGHRVALIQSNKGVAAIEPASGKTVWNYSDVAWSTASTTVSGGKIYVPSQGITVLEPGSPDQPPKQVWRSGQLRAGYASPLVLGQQLFILNDSGILTCADAADGKRKWQLRLKGPFWATPLAAGGYVYCVSESGLVQVIDPSQPEGAVVSELALGQEIVGTPSIAAGALFIRSDAKLWRISSPSPL